MKIRLSDRVNTVPPSETMAITNKAKAMRKQGLDVIMMSAGEPDFDTPEHIKEAARQAMAKGYTKYTPSYGIPELRQAICDKFKKDNNLIFKPEETIVNSGAKQSIYNLIMTLINPGDDVIVPAPYWVSYTSMVMLAGGHSVIVNSDIHSDFKITPAQLAAAITPKTKLMIFCSPSNPTGSVYTRDEIKALADVLLKHPHVYVISDEIYECIVYDDHRHFSMLEIAPDLRERFILCNGVSKSWSMTGWRIGYAAAPVEIIEGMNKIQSQSTSHPDSIAQWAAVTAMTGPTDEQQKMVRAFQERRNYIVERMRGMDGWQINKPQGAFYVFPSVEKLLGRTTVKGQKIATSNDLNDYLLDEHLVAGVPGEAFGADGYIRFSYATSMENIQKALDRIEKATAALR